DIDKRGLLLLLHLHILIAYLRAIGRKPVEYNNVIILVSPVGAIEPHKSHFNRPYGTPKRKNGLQTTGLRPWLLSKKSQ
ncbi:MAG: hypothetical protein JW849_01140, partial [Phycisphaerae bacterium]|nr:hypothetical protein [Phycisphaerae bacterium]